MRRWIVLMALSLAVAPVSAAELIVSAAASLTNAFRDIAKTFEAARPHDRVVLNFGASDVLLAQIAKGAPADVFASADQESMDKADSQGLLQSGTRQNFVRNRLVLVAPMEASVAPASLSALEGPAIKRIAVGNPVTVPVGRYTREALEKAKLWKTLEPKYIYTQNVRQSLDYGARAEVDAGFVYATDAAIMKDKVRIVQDVPTDTPILYPVAIVRDSKNRALAEAFVKFLGAAESQQILSRYGFGKP